MTREIKFRIWRSDGMVYSTGDAFDDGFCLGLNGKIYRVGDSSGDGGYCIECNDYTLMQYTGLIDKNGKEIYESDFVRLAEWQDNPDIYRIHPNIYRVDWYEERAKFQMYSPDELWGNLPNGEPRENDEGIEIFRDFIQDEQIIEVVGNLYENPNLLNNLLTSNKEDK